MPTNVRSHVKELCQGVHCYSDSVDLVRNVSDDPRQLEYEYFVRVATCRLESATVVITPRNPEKKLAHDYYQIIWNELQPAMAEACEQMFHKERLREITVATKCHCCKFGSDPHLAKLRIVKEDMECLRHFNQRNLQGFLLEVVKSSKGDLVYMHMCVYVYRYCVYVVHSNKCLQLLNFVCLVVTKTMCYSYTVPALCRVTMCALIALTCACIVH